MQATPEERESRMRDLAQKLMFKVEKTDGLFTLIRAADVSRPVNEKDLTLKEVAGRASPGNIRESKIAHNNAIAASSVHYATVDDCGCGLCLCLPFVEATHRSRYSTCSREGFDGICGEERSRLPTQ